MMMDEAVEFQYKAPLIAKLLHSLPHYNITFHRTNDTFRPTDEVYLEVNAFQPLISRTDFSLKTFRFCSFHLFGATHRNRAARHCDAQSLGILGSAPAALLIISLFGLLLYLLTRCCDRKPRPAHSITSLKVTLSIVTVLCCAAIGLGKSRQ